MPDISHRGQEMPASPIRKLVPYAEAAKKKGIKVYHLNIGQPDIETPPAALDAVRNFNFKVLEYSHSAGNESYRRKLVKYYPARELISIIIRSSSRQEDPKPSYLDFWPALMPGDEVIIPEPFYANYNGFAVEAGVKVVPVTSYIESGFALPPPEAFEKAITQKTRAIVICNPNNPTGYLYSREEWKP